jgi:hypothetical protein
MVGILPTGWKPGFRPEQTNLPMIEESVQPKKDSLMFSLHASVQTF